MRSAQAKASAYNPGKRLLDLAFHKGLGMIRQIKSRLLAVLLGLSLLAVEGQTRVSMQHFGKTSEGKAVHLYTLSDPAMEVRIMTHCGVAICLRVPWLP